MTISAKYEDGVFKPLDAVAIPDGVVVEVIVPAEHTDKPRSIGDLGFAGMWADRDDFSDGLDYVDRLRDKPRS